MAAISLLESEKVGKWESEMDAATCCSFSPADLPTFPPAHLLHRHGLIHHIHNSRSRTNRSACSQSSGVSVFTVCSGCKRWPTTYLPKRLFCSISTSRRVK